MRFLSVHSISRKVGIIYTFEENYVEGLTLGQAEVITFWN